jgi:hypothetical protein
MGDLAVALGNDMTLPGASASDAATAMLELSKAGLSVNDTMDAAKGTLQLAAAAETDAATAAGMVAGALNAFGLEGNKAAMVADQLAAGANASAASITDLSQGFQAAGFAFNATGQKTDDLITSLAMLTNVGLTGSDAGTALKNAMMQLMAPTDAAAKTMAVRHQCARRTGQHAAVPRHHRRAAIRPQQRLSRGARCGAQDDADGRRHEGHAAADRGGGIRLRRDETKVDQAGAAQAMAAAQMQGFNGALAGVGNAVETLQLIIGAALIPILTMLLNDAVSPAVNALTTFTQGMIAAADPVQFLVTSIDSVLPGFQAFVGFVEANATPILVGLGAILTTIIIPALFSVGVAVVDAAASFLLLIAPFALVGVAAALLYQAFQTNFLGLATIIQPLIDAVMVGFGEGGIGGAFTALIAQLGIVGPQIGAWLLSVGQLILTNVLTWGQAFVAWIAPYIPIVLTALGNLALSIGSWIVAQAPAFLAQLAAWGMAFVNWIAPYVGPALSALGGLISGVLGWIGAQVGPLLGQLAAWGAQFIAWIGPMIGPAIAALGGLASAFFGWIAAQSAPIMAQLQSWGQAFVAWIVPATVQFLAAWPGMLNSFLDWIGSAVPPLLAKLGTWAIAFVSWIAPMIPGFLVAIGGIALAIGAFIVETAAVLIAKLAQWAVAFLAWIAPLIGKIPSAIEGIKLAIGNWIAGAAVSLAKSAADLGKSIVSGIINGVSGAQSALADKLRSMAKSALDAAKSALGIHSPSAVFAQQVGAPIAEGVAAGIVAATPKATAATLDLAGKMVDMISKGVDAFGKLRDLGAVSFGAIQSFTKTIQDTMNLFGQMTSNWNRSMISAAGQFQAKAGGVVEFMSKGVEFLTKLQDFQGVPAAVIHTFADNLKQAVEELIRISTFDMRLAMTSAIEFSASAGKVIDIIGKGVDAFAKLATFAQLRRGVAQAFAISTLWVVKRIGEVAGWIAGEAVAHAGQFAEGAGKVIDLIGKGVDAFIKLSTFTQLPRGVAQAFSISVLWVVKRIDEVAGWIGTKATAAAAVFAEGAGKVIGIIGSGVDAFIKLSTFTQLPVGAAQAFSISIAMVVSTIGVVAQQFKAGAVTAAAQFAESAGKVVGIISSGVDGFNKLAGLAAVPTTAWVLFQDGIYQVMNAIGQLTAQWTSKALTSVAQFAEGAGKAVGIIGASVDGFGKLAALAPIPNTAWVLFQDGIYQVMNAIGQLAVQWTAGAITAAAQFAEGAGKVLGIISNGVTGLKALGDLGPISDQAIQLFAVAINQTMTRLAAVAGQFSADAITHAGQFADAAGKAVGILKNGVEGLLLLNTFTGTSVDAITRFGEGVRLAVGKMAELAAMFGTDATAAATAFANAAGQSTDFLKKGVDGFAKLADFQAVPQASMDLFAAGVVALVNTIIKLSGVLSTDALSQANAFSNAIDTVITVVLSGLKALGDLGNQAAGIKNFTDSLVGQINILAAALATQAQPASMSIGQNIAIGIANGITAGAPAIQNAIFAAVNQALAAARAALGIASPSAVFRDQIGMQMSAGMAEGVMGGMGGVQAAVGQVASGALTAGQGSSTTNNNQRSINFAPGAIVIQGAGQNADAIGDAVVRRLELAIGGRLA